MEGCDMLEALGYPSICQETSRIYRTPFREGHDGETQRKMYQFNTRANIKHRSNTKAHGLLDGARLKDTDVEYFEITCAHSAISNRQLHWHVTPRPVAYYLSTSHASVAHGRDICPILHLRAALQRCWP